MAGVVVARAFWDRMRFSLAAANRLIDREELDTIEDLRELDSKRCERIVGKLIKPGGRTPRATPTMQWRCRTACKLTFALPSTAP